jgi:hypothetical protein
MPIHDTPVLSQAFPARIRAVEELIQAIPTKGGRPDDLRQAADELDRAGPLYGRASTGAIYSAFSQLLRIIALLVEWREGVLGATQDADRFQRAAIENYRLWQSEYASLRTADRIKQAVDGICALRSIEDVGAICEALAKTPLPLGVFAGDSPRLRLPIEDQNEHQPKEEPQELNVAFLRFMIDGAPADATHFLTPGETHDLEIEVRVSRWPAKESLNKSIKMLSDSTTNNEGGRRWIR